MVLLIVLGLLLVVPRVWRRRHGLVGVRGFGPGADLGRLHDAPRVRVGGLAVDGPDRARLLLIPGDSDSATAPTEAIVAIAEGDPEFAILQRWLEDQSVLGVVMRPDNRIIRLRSLDDLQPITLRRLE